MTITEITTRIGAKYEATRGLDIAEVAKLVRADIAEAKKAGALGDLPAGVRITVRIERFSMGRSIDISVANAPDEWVHYYDAESRAAGDRSSRLSTECVALGRKLAEILGAYNRDASDSMTDYHDVRFWASVRIRPAGWSGYRTIA